jgi:hypothetical protein
MIRQNQLGMVLSIISVGSNLHWDTETIKKYKNVAKGDLYTLFIF